MSEKEKIIDEIFREVRNVAQNNIIAIPTGIKHNYVYINNDEEDMNDWLDEYFLTYAPQSVCNTSEKDDCQSECKKECKDKKECCIKCACSIKDLMAYGCRCGAAKKEKDSK